MAVAGLLAVLAARPGRAAGVKSLSFTAQDGVEIAADWHLAGTDPGPRLILVAPGFAQHKGTVSMRALAQALTAVADVLIIDFRGTGESGGRYWFGSKEYLDLEPALQWARRGYKDVSLLGLSLGAYSSVRAAGEGSHPPDRLLLVSCPTKVDWVILGGGALWHTLNYLFRDMHFKIPRQNAPFFRWGPIFAPKPDAAALGPRITIPAFCLVGGKDTLVFEKQSRKVFDSLAGAKFWKKVADGAHAEGMFLQDPEGFIDWVRESINTSAKPVPNSENEPETFTGEKK
jgi:pimeloyl-ACP methyl ester carboxylesterase